MYCVPTDRMPKTSTSSDESVDDLTVSLPVGGYNSLPTTPEHKSHYLRTQSHDPSPPHDEADGNTVSINSKSLTRGGR